MQRKELIIIILTGQHVESNVGLKKQKETERTHRNTRGGLDTVRCKQKTMDGLNKRGGQGSKATDTGIVRNELK